METPKHYNSSTRPADMTNRVLLALVCVLLVVRLPSLVQPMGADEGLYAYVGQQILEGGLPYLNDEIVIAGDHWSVT